MKKLITLVMTTVLVSVFLVGCGAAENIGTLDVSDSTTSPETVESNTAEMDETENVDELEPEQEEVPEEDNQSSDGPDLILPVELPDGRGGMTSFSQYEGKMLFVNFFGTWCTYCMQEMPDFQTFTENYSDSATIVIVNAFETEDITMDEVVEWYNENGYSMPMVFDEDQSKTAEFYGAIQGFPTTFVFNEQQEFLGYIGGMMDYSMLEEVMTNYSGQ
jgi:cytochrome c-type biogenesis protein